MRDFRRFVVLMAALSCGIAAAQTRRLESADYLKLRTVDAVQISPDGARVAYTVKVNDVPRRARQSPGLARLGP